MLLWFFLFLLPGSNEKKKKKKKKKRKKNKKEIAEKKEKERKRINERGLYDLSSFSGSTTSRIRNSFHFHSILGSPIRNLLLTFLNLQGIPSSIPSLGSLI